MVKTCRRPEHAFARRYKAADLALPADLDRGMGMLSGPATACVLRRQRDVFKVPVSSRWATSRWPICTTCATARDTEPSAWGLK